MNHSYWDRTLLPEKFDYVIIGSGIVGLTAALHCKQRFPDKQIAVLEKGITPAGASTKNAGFACFGSLSEIVDDFQHTDEVAVLELIRERWEGLRYLHQLTHGDDIGFETLGGYEVFTPELSELYEQCMQQLTTVNKLLKPLFNRNVFSEANQKISEFRLGQTQHMLENPFEGQLHTGKLMQVLLKKCLTAGVMVLFGAHVENWHESDLQVEIALRNGFALQTEKLIVATNGFTGELLPTIPVEPARAQVLLTAPVANLKLRGTFHMDRGYYYFRNIDQRVLLGGARHIDKDNERTTAQVTSAKIQDALDLTLQSIVLPYTNYSVDMRWVGTMGVGEQKSPIVERITDRTALAVRMGGMGVAIGSRIGQKVAYLKW